LAKLQSGDTSILVFAPVATFKIGFLTAIEWKLALGHALTAMGTTQIVLAVAIILLILDIALVLVALARFRRTELLLD